MIGFGPRCLYCKHWKKHWKCDAFPEKIPMSIADGKVQHLTPYEGDHGIQFEIKPDLSELGRECYEDQFGSASK